MLFPVAAMVAGFVLIFRGVTVFGCKTVSFSHSFTTCYTNELGALPGDVAALGLMGTGVALFFLGMKMMSTVR